MPSPPFVDREGPCYFNPAWRSTAHGSNWHPEWFARERENGNTAQEKNSIAVSSNRQFVITGACELLLTGDPLRVLSQFEDVEAGICTVHDVNIATIVCLQIVALDCGLAAILALDLDAAPGRSPR